jgi:hypothetical protein
MTLGRSVRAGSIAMKERRRRIALAGANEPALSFGFRFSSFAFRADG